MRRPLKLLAIGVLAAVFFLLFTVLLYTTAPELVHTAATSARRKLARRQGQEQQQQQQQQPSLASRLALNESMVHKLGMTRRFDADSLLARVERKLLPFHTEKLETDPPCKDEHDSCKQWAASGECSANPVYMRNSCPASCDSCSDIAKRRRICHRTLETQPLLRSGGIDATFVRLLALMEPTHEVIVHSRPPKGPWIVTIEDFLAEHEIRAMIEKGGHHFERSLAGDGISPVRTSKTSWCNVPFCEADPTIRSIKNRVANVTGVPLQNSEHVQVLHYDPGDFYRQHHDQNAHPQSPWGPRLFTFFLYLNYVEEGGGTRFNHLNLTVDPKPGRALMWPSVFDEDPSATKRVSDHRTTHEALTVVTGSKLAANMWLHQYDFQTTLAAGCKNEDHSTCGDCDGPDLGSRRY